MTNFIAHIATFAGFFGLLDVMLHKSVREQFSWYIFGFAEYDFPKVEHLLITSLIDFLLRPTVFQTTLRLWSISFVLSYLILVFFSFVAPERDSMLLILLIGAPALAIPIAMCSLPVDYLSAIITRAIFARHRIPLKQYPFWMLCDGIVSILPLGAIIFAVLLVDSGFDLSLLQDTFDLGWRDPFPGVIYAGLSFSGFSIFFLTAVQVTAFILGTALRAFSVILRLNLIIALNSNVHNFPFTFMGILIGLFVFAIWGV